MTWCTSGALPQITEKCPRGAQRLRCRRAGGGEAFCGAAGFRPSLFLLCRNLGQTLAL